MLESCAMPSPSRNDDRTSTVQGVWPHLALPPDFDMDVFLVERGLRELGKWEGVPDESLQARRSHLAALGLASRVVPGPPSGVSVVFFSASEATLDDAERLEVEYRATRSYADRAPSSRELGRLLGYPACCVEVWATGPQHDEGALARLDARVDDPAPALLNFFPRHFAPVGFVPCHLRCGEALRHGRRVANALERAHAIDLAALEEALRGVVLWLSGPLFVLFRGVEELDTRGFRFASVVSPLDSPAFPDIPEIRDQVTFLRALAEELRRGGEVRIEDGALRASTTGPAAPSPSALARRLIAFGP